MRQIKKILFITLSNIGDVILTLPVLDGLRALCPDAEITVLVGPRPAPLFEDNPYVRRVIVYDKYASLYQKWKLLNILQKENFDIVIDLRNSFFGLFLAAPYKTSPFLRIPPKVTHMRDRHWYKIQTIVAALQSEGADLLHRSLPTYQTDWRYIEGLLRENGIYPDDTIVVVSAGARSEIKRWGKEKFVRLIEALVKEFMVKIVCIGDQDDIPVNQYITQTSKAPVVDLTGMTTVRQVAALLKKASLLITNDSANLHLASYEDVPVVAIFGPTDDAQYGPWSVSGKTVKKELFCRPCMKAQCRFGTLECMERVSVNDVLRQVKEILATSRTTHSVKPAQEYKRILIVRTDRMGDVILSTPVISALRDAYPNAYIAIVVRPFTQAVVQGNPFLDEVILYDKDKKHKGWLTTFAFSRSLAKKKFDLAVVLNPSNRSNLIPWLAAIPKRIGYDRKSGFLLTDKMKDVKYEGKKHEIEYNLDCIRLLGLDPRHKNTFMPIDPDSEQWADRALAHAGVQPTDTVVVINPGASEISKIWPAQRYAAVADSLSQKGFKIIILGGPQDKKITDEIARLMQFPYIDMVGNNDISQAASLLRRVSLFISADTGPMHLASSLDTPVVALFGRRRPGLSPLRWGPHNKNSIVLHKDIGCEECTAHNCTWGFKCLEAITVEDVLEAAHALLVSLKKNLTNKQ